MLFYLTSREHILGSQWRIFTNLTLRVPYCRRKSRASVKVVEDAVKHVLRKGQLQKIVQLLNLKKKKRIASSAARTQTSVWRANMNASFVTTVHSDSKKYYIKNQISECHFGRPISGKNVTQYLMYKLNWFVIFSNITQVSGKILNL